jgi:hypothetical protein
MLKRRRNARCTAVADSSFNELTNAKTYFVFQAAEFRDFVMSEKAVKLVSRNQWLILF